MLSSSLRDLESPGIVGRKQFNEIPPHVEYSLMEKGKALLPVFFEMAKWGETYFEKDGEAGVSREPEKRKKRKNPGPMPWTFRLRRGILRS